MRSRRSAMLVIGFVVVDLVVLALAYGLTHREDHVTPSAAAVSTDDGIDRKPPIEGPLVLAAAPGGALVRITQGSCDSRERIAPRVWIARSFKASLDEVTVPALQQTLGVSVADGRVTVVGALKDCEVASFTSTDDGTTWTQGKVGSSVWSVSTDTTKSTLTGPTAGGTLNLDCTPVSVVTQASDGAGLVTCSGGTVLDVSPGVGKAPAAVTTVAVAGASGVAVAADGSVLALGTSDSCTSALVATSAGQQQETRQVACFDDLGGATLGLATSGDRVFAQIGYRLLVSSNGGKSFQTYPGQADSGGSASASPDASPDASSNG